MKKTLYILRHAKAETGTATQEDFDRGLVERGLQAAAMIAAYMLKQKMRPQRVWCSSAARTRQTVMKLQESFVPPLDVEYRDKMYNASAGEMLSMLASLGSDVQSAMLVAHNPGMHQLAVKLAREGDDDTLDMLAIKFPTASLAVVEFDTENWRDVAVSSGRLVEFITPSMLGGVDD